MEYLPLFPNFRSFTINDIHWYRDFYLRANLNPYADVQYENLLVWLNLNNDLQIAKIDEQTLVFKYTNPLDNNKLNLIPLSEKLTDEVIVKIFDYLSSNGLPESIQEIPSIICSSLDCQKWQIDEYRDGAEYILDNKQQINLEGSDFSRQRRRIDYFEREHKDDAIEISYFDQFNEEITNAFLHHIEHMRLNNSSEAAKNNTYEATVIKRNLELALSLNKKALIVKKNNEIIALAMISFLDEKTAAINHLKVDYSTQYIFQYTLYKLANVLCEHGIEEMNLEQDLGIEGLRTFKERLNPSRMLKKVIISPKR